MIDVDSLLGYRILASYYRVLIALSIVGFGFADILGLDTGERYMFFDEYSD